MTSKNLLACSIILTAASSVALASPIDPRMIIDATDPSPIPISTGVNSVVPDGTSFSQTFDFVNDLGVVITGFDFRTNLATGFNPLDFTCASGYFLSCVATYNPTTGDLQYLFSGVNPPDPGDPNPLDTQVFPFDDFANEMKGIPLHGLFHITIEGFNTEGLFNDEHPIMPFSGTILTAVPEPSSLSVLLAGLAVMAAALEFRRRRAA